MSWNVWRAFLAACMVIAVTPGSGAVPSIATGLRHGYPRALRAIAGLEAALLVHALLVQFVRSPRMPRAHNRVIGRLFVGAGALLAASSR